MKAIAKKIGMNFFAMALPSVLDHFGEEEHTSI